MDRAGRNKRPRTRNPFENRTHKRQRATGHVQNSLAQTLHEASGSSEAPFRDIPAPSSQASLSSVTSSPPKCEAESGQHVPHLQHVQLPNAYPSRQMSSNASQLPQIPPIPDKKILNAVFTHPSYLSGHVQSKLDISYDRLEFLGDAYLELMASRLVFTLYPHLPAGRLSQQRESLIKNETLASLSLAYGFDKRARLPTGLRKSPSTNSNSRQVNPEKTWIKTLGDIFEAYAAAVVVSNPLNGYQLAEEWLHKLWIPKLQAQDPDETRTPPATNSKQELSKRIMGKGNKLDYQETNDPDMSDARAGKTWYTISVFFTGWGWEQMRLGEGRGLNKMEAGMAAAIEALQNPLTEQIARIKREFDRKVAEERAAREINAGRSVAVQRVLPTTSKLGNEQMKGQRVKGELEKAAHAPRPNKVMRKGDEEGEISDSDDSGGNKRP